MPLSIARKVKAWCQEARQDEVIVQVDLRTRLTLDRGVLLGEFRHRGPALYPYVHASNSSRTTLFGNGFVHESPCGV